MKTPLRFLLTLGLLLATSPLAVSYAQTAVPGSVDPSFANVLNTQGAITQTVVQPDGKIIALGSFLPSNAGPYFMRLNPDGTLDSTFNSERGGGLNIPGQIRAFALQPDGKIVYVGNGVDGVTQVSIGRLNANGRLDESFKSLTSNPTSDATVFDVSAVTVQADGKILVGGNFQNLNGAPRPGLARLNADGTVDPSFAPPTAGIVFSSALAIAVQADGKVLVAGRVILNGQRTAGIARLLANGSVDTAFTPQTLTLSVSDFKTLSIVTQPDGKILLGGRFTSVGTNPRAYLVRLLPTGSVDSSFNDLVGGRVFAVALQGDGKLLVGGDFQNVGTARAGVARLNADGSLDAAFDPGSGAGFNTVNTLALQADGKVIVGGDFTSFGNVTTKGLTRLLNDYTGANGGGTGNSAFTVPGTANLWLAGAAPGSTASTGQDNLANATPFRVPGITLTANAILTFSATGNVSNDPANPVAVGPDGGPYLGRTFYGHDKENGIASIVAPINSLIGVFLDDSVPNANTAPDGLDFSAGAGIDYTLLAPSLRKPFFIGDGKAANNPGQQIQVPAGATRLFLGSLDPSDQENNLGSFTVTINGAGTGGGATTGAVLAVTDTSFKSTSDATGQTALPSDTLTYTFTVRNTGNAAANNVRLTDRLSGVKFKSADNNGALAANSTIDVVFPAFTLAAGASQTFTVKAKVPGTANVTDGITVGNIIYTVTADAPATGITSSKSVSQVSTVVSPYRLTYSVNSNPMAGDLITARFSFSNLATTTAAKTFALIHLPANVTLDHAAILDAQGNETAAAGRIGQNGNRDIVFVLGDVPSVAGYDFIVVVRVPVDVAPGSNVTFDYNRVVVGGAVDGQVNVSGGTIYNEPGITVRLSTTAPTAVPKLVLDKLIPDGTTLKTLFGFNPKLALQLQNSFVALGYKIVKTDAAGTPLKDAFNNPVLDFDQIGALGAFLNPNVGQNGDDTDPAAPIYTVAAPSNKVPAPYVTFTLLLSNLGGTKAVDIAIQDRIPAGFAFNPNGDNVSSHQDLVFINGVPSDPSNFAFDNARRSLLFNLPAAKVKDGKPVLIIYQLNVLPTAQGGPNPGSVVDTKGAKYASASFSQTEIPAAGDGPPVLIVSPIHFFVESKKPTGKTAPINGNTKINIFYKNDGGQKTLDFRLVSTVPKGATFYRSVLLDANENERAANPAKGESVDNPAFGATTGQVVFHLGKLKPGQSGFVQVEYRVTDATLATQLLTSHRAYVTNISYNGQLPVAAVESGPHPVARAGGRPVTHDDNAPAVGGASTGSITTSRDPNLPRLTAGVAAPAAVREGQTFDYLVYAANPGGAQAGGVQLFFYLPAEVELAAPLSDFGVILNDNGRTVAAFPTTSPDFKQQFPINGHTAMLRKVTVRVRAGSAGKTLRATAKTTGGFGTINMLNGQTIPVKSYALPEFLSGTVSSMAIGPNDNFNLLGGAIATSTAADYGLSGSSLQKYALNLNPGTMNKTLGGTDAVSLNNGVVIVPLGAGNALAIGTRNTLIATGGGNLVNGNGVSLISQDGAGLISQDGAGLIAQGGGNLIGVANLVSEDGTGLISQDGAGLARNGVGISSLLAKLISQDGAGLIAQGGGNILRGGGGNLISDDGLGVVSNDGGSLRALNLAGVVSNDGGSLAAGASNLITDNGGALVGTAGGTLVGNAGSTLAASRGGNILTAGGAAGLITDRGGSIISDNSAGIRGTPDASFALHVTGAGLVAQGGGN